MYDSFLAQLGSLEEVNEWVKTATQGQVTDFLSSLPPNVVLMLINAVHFKGKSSAWTLSRTWLRVGLSRDEPVYCSGGGGV